MTKDPILIKQNLDKLYNECNYSEYILHDPIKFPHKFSTPEDIEIVGFIAASFAYGRIDLFTRIIEKILNIMGRNPYDFLVNSDIKKYQRLFSSIGYRFSNSDDIIAFLLAIHKILKKYRRLENLFKSHFSETDKNIGKALADFINVFLNIMDQALGKQSGGFLHFFPSPTRGSACKRLALFLRWMVRDKDIDMGIWKGIPKNRLVIPLDVHIARISRCLGLTKRKSADWKAAVEITESLKSFDYEDPLKYDFALCHLGVSKVCCRLMCRECSLFSKG